MRRITALGFLLLATIICRGQAKRQFDQVLADSLNRWMEVDQIAAMNARPAGAYAYMTQQQWTRFKDSVYSTHEKLLDKIFEKNGYPGYDLAGEKRAHYFWLMVQHCDKDPGFQQRILTAMKKEVDKGNASGKDYGYLTDRVNLNTGKKQLYGTQVTYNLDSCQAIPRPLADSLTVNIRRKQIGMEPIEVYLNFMSQFHFDMNKETYEKKGITKPKLLVVTNHD